MTLSKLKQEGREEAEKFLVYVTNEKNWVKGKPVWKGYAYVTLFNATLYFLTAQIEKAYLSALADVKKWTKGRNVTKDSLREVINKLKESK